MTKYQFNPLFEGKLGRAIDSRFLKDINLIKDPEIKKRTLHKIMNQIKRERKTQANTLKSFRNTVGPKLARSYRDIAVLGY